jgi:hypothetical protein
MADYFKRTIGYCLYKVTAIIQAGAASGINFCGLLERVLTIIYQRVRYPKTSYSHDILFLLLVRF